MPPIKPSHEVHGFDANHCIQIDYDLCIGCGACARVCCQTQEFNVLTNSGPKLPPNISDAKGCNDKNTANTRVLLNDSLCTGCGQCTQACGFNALKPKMVWDKVETEIKAKKIMVAVLAPSTRVGIAEAMGMPVGVSAEKQLIQSLKDLGFQYVFDNQWGADTCTIEDAKEAIHMKHEGKGPALTSCCPAWVNLIETKYPHLIPQVSTARSPHGDICGAIRKHWVKEMKFKQEDVCVVGFMPCTAKKSEAARKQLSTDGVQDCNISVTSKELADVLKNKNVAFNEAREKELMSVKCDPPFDQFSGSSYIYGKTAGVTESVIRYVKAINKEKFDMAEVKQEVFWTHADKIQTITILSFQTGGQDWKVAVSHGGGAANKVAELVTKKELKVDLVEVMVCTYGCQGGAGQPRQLKKPLIQERQKGLEAHDHQSAYGDCEHNASMHEFVKKHMPSESDVKTCFHTYLEDRSPK